MTVLPLRKATGYDILIFTRSLRAEASVGRMSRGGLLACYGHVSVVPVVCSSMREKVRLKTRFNRYRSSFEEIQLVLFAH